MNNSDVFPEIPVVGVLIKYRLLKCSVMSQQDSQSQNDRALVQAEQQEKPPVQIHRNLEVQIKKYPGWGWKQQMLAENI